MNETPNFKQKIASELRLFLGYFAFFALFFTAFAIYRRLLLDQFGMDYIHYSYSIIEALILSKLLLLGQHFKLGDKYKDKPLIIPTLYKTFIFSLFVMAFSVGEHMIFGYLHGKTTSVIYNELIEKGIYQILAALFIMSFAFVFFFAFLEINKRISNPSLFELFFRKRPDSKLPGR